MGDVGVHTTGLAGRRQAVVAKAQCVWLYGSVSPGGCCQLLRRLCCADEEAPLSPGALLIAEPWVYEGPRRMRWACSWELAPLEAGGAPGLLPQWALSLHGGHRARGLGAAGGFRLTPDPRCVTKGPPSPAREGGPWREVCRAHQGLHWARRPD